jgi:hypothetical protein
MMVPKVVHVHSQTCKDACSYSEKEVEEAEEIRVDHRLTLKIGSLSWIIQENQRNQNSPSVGKGEAEERTREMDVFS